jgi:sulfide:quinone oxidoreductase
MTAALTTPEEALAGAQPAAPGVVHHEIVVVGGGSAGLTVAARLARKLRAPDLAVIEPSAKHWYQPLWTLVGGGAVDKRVTERPQASVVPRGAKWIQDAAVELVPDESLVRLASGREVSYDWLVLAPGIELAWDLVPGLTEALGNGVGTIWSYEWADRTWELIRDFKGGTAVFTFPATPIKCPGAAQKIAYLADDWWRRTGVRDNSRIVYAAASPKIFAVEKYARTLAKVVERKGIETLFRHNLVEIRPGAREAVFRGLDSGEEVVIRYDLLHVAPPQRAARIVRESSLANADGWLEVDKHTLRHPRYANVFGLGDASSLPTSKTGAAVRAQAKVLTANLLAARDGRALPASYDGYTACPLVTGYGKLVLAEFDYDLNPKETFPFDQSKERWSMYQLKKRGLPLLYWNGMLKGRA